MPARVLNALACAPPVEMVIFSCDSATFSRDLGFLLERGFVLMECALIDNFPQSDHMEIAARLQGPIIGKTGQDRRKSGQNTNRLPEKMRSRPK
ncbi:MAG TPA: hypothetical protein ENN40_06945 [Candidatus Aminicenantes bacterium]|nr:hypothetical protein [Candidatus Aminicenantes bacterium]